MAFMATYPELCAPYLHEDIRGEYGLPLNQRFAGEQGYHRNGPFSYATYLKHMLKRGSYADSAIVWVFGQMWGLRITVIDALTLSETRYRHHASLVDADLVLIHVGAHYTGVCKYSIDVTHLLVDVTC